MVSDTYTLQFLVQETETARLQWRERSGGGFTTNVDGVEILLEEIPTRTGTRLGLRFRLKEDEFWVYSPLATKWWSPRYASQEDQDLAEWLPRLLKAVMTQHLQRMNHDAEHPEEVRTRIYQRLLFGQPT